MEIFLKKFGTTLISRPSGSEAFKAFRSTLDTLPEKESIEIDFEGVRTLAPSWGDEFLTPLITKYNRDVVLKNLDNLSVQATLDILESTNNIKFKRS